MAKKAQSTLPNMMVSLTAIALVAAAILAALNAITKEPIEKAQQVKVEEAISAVLPTYASVENREVEGYVCHVGLDSEGQRVGVAVEAESSKGYGGRLKLMVGFDGEGKVFGYQILETHETPGLGAKASQWFQQGGKGNIIGRTGEMKVRKDGGDVDAISGSTITSRAFLSIVSEAGKIAAKCNQ